MCFQTCLILALLAVQSTQDQGQVQSWALRSAMMKTQMQRMMVFLEILPLLLGVGLYLNELLEAVVEAAGEEVLEAVRILRLTNR